MAEGGSFSTSFGHEFKYNLDEDEDISTLEDLETMLEGRMEQFKQKREQVDDELSEGDCSDLEK
jgi:hypothetical protein